MNEMTTLHIPSSIRLVELQRLAVANGMSLTRRKDGSYEMTENEPAKVIRINFNHPPKDPRPAA